MINNIKISYATAYRILKRNNLRRRIRYTLKHIVINDISNEIETSGRCIGYRSIWKRLVNEHRIRFPRDKVLSIMKTIDFEVVTIRKAHRLIDASTEQNDPIMFGILTDMTNRNLVAIVYIVLVAAEVYFC